MREYQADLTLCRLAAIAISKRLWMHSELRGKLESCAGGNSFAEYEMPSEIDRVMDHFNVPEAAKQELRFAVGSMGVEMLRLLHRLQGQSFPGMAEDAILLKSEVSTCIDDVCWTTSGCIDAAETVRSLYFAGKFRENFETCNWLCIHCLEDCITDLWPKLGNADQYRRWRNRQPVRSDTAWEEILSEYWSARMNDGMEDLIHSFRQLLDHFYDDAYSLEGNMFIGSFICRQDSAVEYFWGLLNENQRRMTIARMSENIMSYDPNGEKDRVLFFAGSQPPNAHFNKFFLHHLSRYGLDHVRDKLLSLGFVLGGLIGWPYDNMFIDTLRESSTHHNFIDFNPIISHILARVHSCRKVQFIEWDVRYRQMFYRIWRMNPHNLKSSIDYKKALDLLWRGKHIDVLSHIFRDKELEDRREVLLTQLAEIDDPDDLDMICRGKFVVQVLHPQEKQFWLSR